MSNCDARSANRPRVNRDRLITISLLIVTLALRVPFRSQILFHWDSAEFAIAVMDYDVRLSQPHAPGYFLYVMLGRLVNPAVGDPHACLFWLSVAARRRDKKSFLQPKEL